MQEKGPPVCSGGPGIIVGKVWLS